MRDQKLHDDSILFLAEELVKRGYNVLADHGSWPLSNQPIAINGYKPDIIAMNSFERCIYEVETSKSYQSRYTVNQLVSFNMKGKEDFTTYLVLTGSEYKLLVGGHFLKAQTITRNMEYVRVAHLDLARSEYQVFT
ncbi:hypothetical protein [Paenibacillus phytorum]|nr:hypothetical protein [Paenibacillus phytorum]